MFWAKSATQAVPSACSRWPPVGRGALRSNTPIFIEAEEAALKQALAEPVFAVGLSGCQLVVAMVLMNTMPPHPGDSQTLPSLSPRLTRAELGIAADRRWARASPVLGRRADQLYCQPLSMPIKAFINAKVGSLA
jgi:hypothetical protein